MMKKKHKKKHFCFLKTLAGRTAVTAQQSDRKGQVLLQLYTEKNDLPEWRSNSFALI